MLVDGKSDGDDSVRKEQEKGKGKKKERLTAAALNTLASHPQRPGPKE